MKETRVERIMSSPVQIQAGAPEAPALHPLATWIGSCVVEAIWAKGSTNGESSIPILLSKLANYVLLLSLQGYVIVLVHSIPCAGLMMFPSLRGVDQLGAQLLSSAMPKGWSSVLSTRTAPTVSASRR